MLNRVLIGLHGFGDSPSVFAKQARLEELAFNDLECTHMLLPGATSRIGLGRRSIPTWPKTERTRLALVDQLHKDLMAIGEIARLYIVGYSDGAYMAAWLLQCGLYEFGDADGIVYAGELAAGPFYTMNLSPDRGHGNRVVFCVNNDDAQVPPAAVLRESVRYSISGYETKFFRGAGTHFDRWTIDHGMYADFLKDEEE